jgi:hypothetical protein
MMSGNSMGLGVSEIACIAYDADTGDVLHVHVDTTLDGAEKPTEDDVRAATLELHSQLFKGRKRASVATIFVNPAELNQPGARKVDLKSRTLVVSPVT